MTTQMQAQGWLQIGLYIAVLLLLAKPLGAYMAAVYEGRALRAHRVGGWLERLIYRGAGVDAAKDMTWVEYALAMLWFSVVSWLMVYTLQSWCRISIARGVGTVAVRINSHLRHARRSS
jgi:potassium-transporting ATPase potassium-binding subunit